MTFQLSGGAFRIVQRYMMQKTWHQGFVDSLSQAIAQAVWIDYQKQTGKSLPDGISLQVDERGSVTFIGADGQPLRDLGAEGGPAS